MPVDMAFRSYSSYFELLVPFLSLPLSYVTRTIEAFELFLGLSSLSIVSSGCQKYFRRQD